MKVTLVQPLGSKLDVYLGSEAGSSLVAQLDPFAKVAVGDVVPVYFDLNRVHFFAAGERGERLANARER